MLATWKTFYMISIIDNYLEEFAKNSEKISKEDKDTTRSIVPSES